MSAETPGTKAVGVNLSIITPCFDPNPVFLADTASSVRSLQGLLPLGWSIEWLVRFDGPLEHPLPQPARSVGLNGDRLGPAATRNAAFAHASGDYVMTLDADDMVGDMVNALRRLAADPGLAWVAGQSLDLHPDATMTGRDAPWPEGPLPVGAILDLWSSTGRFPFQGSGPFVARADVVRAVGGWSTPHGFSDDAILATKVSEVGRGWFTRSNLHIYRRHPAQRTATTEFAAGRAERVAATIRDLLDRRVAAAA